MLLVFYHLISLQSYFGRRGHHLSWCISFPIHHVNQVGSVGKPMGGQGGSSQPGFFSQLLVDVSHREALSLSTSCQGWPFPQSCHSYSLCLCPHPGWRTHHAAYPLDASREHHVQKVHNREWRLELRGDPLGDLHVREAALVSALKHRGTTVLRHLSWKL